MLSPKFANILMLRGLEPLKWNVKTKTNVLQIWAKKKSHSEVCPKCATLCKTIYDHRTVKIKDEPLRGQAVLLYFQKRRFFCKTCQKPFTEQLNGIQKRSRVTDRYRQYVFWACEQFGDLSSVRKEARCSASFLYKTYYTQLDKNARSFKRAEWPTTIGIDEHSFKRNKTYGHTEFVTVFVNYNKRRLVEVVEGKQGSLLKEALVAIPKPENVRHVILDLADSYKSFAQSYFPNAQLIADKFHVLRLLNPTLNKYRKLALGESRNLPVRKLLLANGERLDCFTRHVLWKGLAEHDALRNVYMFKEGLHRLYRCKGVANASLCLTRLTDAMAHSSVPEILSLRKTLMKWRYEILAYFETRLTNARTEGFNNKAKVIKRRAYGYRNFKNYRLRLLNACC